MSAEKTTGCFFYAFEVTCFFSTVSSNRWRHDVFGRKCMMNWEGVQGAPALLPALVDTTKSKGWLCFQKYLWSESQH